MARRLPRSAFLPGLFLLAVAAGAVAPALAQQSGKVYRWQDAEGNVHYSDRLPAAPDARNRRILNEAGIQVGDLDARPAEVDAGHAERLAGSRRDWALASSYENESELRRAQEERLALLRNGVAMARANIDKLATALAEQEAHAQTVSAGAAVPLAVQQRVEETRRMLDEQRAELDRLQRRYIDSVEQQEAELLRYRALTAGDDEAGESDD